MRIEPGYREGSPGSEGFKWLDSGDSPAPIFCFFVFVHFLVGPVEALAQVISPFTVVFYYTVGDGDWCVEVAASCFQFLVDLVA